MLETEQELADKLKQQCYKNGKEKDPKSSAKLLHKLGIVYRSKSPDRQSLMQSAALMTSAIIRQPDNVNVIEQHTTELLSHLLQLAQAKSGPELIREAVVDLKCQVQDLRTAMEQKLEALKPIPDDAVNEDWKRAQKQKIKDVERLQAFVTKTYADIMSSVCKHCSKVMGDAPCKFTLVGMGSLARKEITPYSDFESIIVLEEEVQHADDYDDILEYFRWFSTIFQIILIQLGETPLRFLAIPCLNDPLNSENNWFYDEFTPCGICPDGFAPPACKNPLGRQLPTTSKPWTTELIKPISEMLKYLDSDEDIKNGYHLADILMKTCYVAGCEDVYRAFRSAVHRKLRHQFRKNRNELFIRTRLQIKEDVERYQEIMYDSGTAMFLDVKRVLYRVPTLHVSNLGRLYNLKEASCLDILDKLCTLNVMTASDSFKLKFSVSVACEIRLRTYASNQSQSDLVPQMYLIGEKVKDIQPIFDEIGAKAVVSCYTSAFLLQVTLSIAVELGTFPKKNPFFLPPEPKWLHVVSCAKLMLYDYGLKACQELLPQSKSLQLLERFHVFVTYAQCLNSVGRESEAAKVFKEQRTTASELAKQLSAEDSLLLYQYYFDFGKISVETGEYKNGLKYFRKLNFLIFKFPVPLSERHNLLFNMGKCYMLMGRCTKALTCFDKINFEEKKLLQQQFYVDLLYHKALCFRDTGRFHEAKSCIESIKQCRKMLVGEDKFDWWLKVCLYVMVDCLIGLKKFEEALDMCEKAWRQENLKRKKRIFYLDLKSRCLLRLNRDQEALPVLKEYLEALKKSNYKKSSLMFAPKDSIASCLQDLAVCTYDLDLYEEAAKFSQEAIEELYQCKQKGKPLDKNFIAHMRYILITSKEKIAHLVYRTQPLSLENVAEVNFYSSKEEVISLFHIASFYAKIDDHPKAIKYFKAVFNVLTERTTMIDNRKVKKSLFEHFSHDFVSDHYRLLLANSLEEINQDDEALIQRRQAWREASQLNWWPKSSHRKYKALCALASSFHINLRKECLRASEYLLNLFLERITETNSVQPLILHPFQLYLLSRLLFRIDCSSLPYSYTPSIYHHVLHLLIDNPDICCYEWRDVCREYSKNLLESS